MSSTPPVSLLDRADWSFPVPILYGPGRLAELSDVAANAGMARPLVVTDRGSSDLPLIAQALHTLRRAGMTGFSVGSRVVVSQGASRHVTTVASVDPAARSIAWSDDIAAGDLATF